MSMVADFDFMALEPLAPPVTRANEADAVMEILAEARAEADTLREAARAEGFAEGRADAVAALEPALAALTQALADVRDQQVVAAVALERRAVALGLALARKVLAGALEVEPERVLDSVTGALRGIVER